jgi:hypothetical protein
MLLMPIAAIAPVHLMISMTQAEMIWIEHKARQAGDSSVNYARKCLGLRMRAAGRPTADEIEDRKDDAWDLLQKSGLDPRAYFPPEVNQPPAEDEETPEERAERVRKLRAVTGAAR